MKLTREETKILAEAPRVLARDPAGGSPVPGALVFGAAVVVGFGAIVLTLVDVARGVAEGWVRDVCFWVFFVCWVGLFWSGLTRSAFRPGCLET